MPAGRPKITLDDLPSNWKEDMLSAATEGKSELNLRISILNRLAHDTWERLIKEEPEFSDTVKECRALIENWWHELGRKGACGQDSINPTVWIFNMKNRFNWRDKQDIETSGSMTVTVSNEDASTA